MTKRFVSVGECMMELAPIAMNGTYQANYCGDTFNTAWYLRKELRAHWSVDFVTKVGNDKPSKRMVDFIANANIGTHHIGRDDKRTIGLYMIELENGEREFSYWRGQSAARQLADDGDFLENSFHGADVIYFSGITLAILSDDARKRFLAHVNMARSRGSLVVFDSNLRPKLWHSNEVMCKEIMNASACADVILPSYDDEMAYFGDETPTNTAHRYLKQGAKLIIVKNGAGEIISHSGDKTDIHSPQFVGEPIDTTAAGDSFNAGFLSVYLETGDIPHAVQRASSIAGKVICGKGALVEIN